MPLPKLRKFLLIFLLAILGVLMLIFVTLNLPSSQRFATGKVNQILHRSNIPIHIDAIRKIMPGSVMVQGVLIAEPEGDSIIYAGNLQADIRLFALLRSKVIIQDVDMERAFVDLARKSALQELNIAAVFQSAKKNEAVPVEKEPASWEISIQKGTLSDIVFRMTDSLTGVNMSCEVSELALKGFLISLSDRDIRCKSLDVNGAEGSVNKTPRLIAENTKTGVPWNMGLLGLRIRDIDFTFVQTADGLKMETHIGEGKMLAKELDLLSRTADIKNISLLNSSFVLGSEPMQDYHDIDVDIKDFRLGIDGAGMKVSKVSLEMGNGFSLKNLKGEIDFNQEQTQLQLEIETGNSHIGLKGNAEEGIMDIMQHPEEIRGAVVNLSQARVSLKDFIFFDSDLEESPLFAFLSSSPIELGGTLKLNESLMDFSDLKVSQGSNFNLALEGSIENPYQFPDSKGDLDLEISGIERLWLDCLLAGFGVDQRLPDLSDMHIRASISDSLISPHMRVTIKSHLGELDLAGLLDLQKKDFKLGFGLSHFFLGEFLSIPDMGSFTGTGEIKGRGFKEEDLHAGFQIQIDSLDFREYKYRRILLVGTLNPGEYVLNMVANDSSLKGDLNVDLNLADSLFTVKASGHAMAQLNQLHLYDEPLTIETDLELFLTGRENELESEISAKGLTFTGSQERAVLEQLNASFRTDTVKTLFHADTDFFNMDMRLSMPFAELDSLEQDYKFYLASFSDPTHLTSADRVSGLPALDASGQLKYHPLLEMFLGDSGLYFSNLDFSVVHPPEINHLTANIKGDSIGYKKARTGTLHAALTDSAGIINFDLTTDQLSLFSGHGNSLKLSGDFTNWSTLTSLSVYDSLSQDVYYAEVSGRVDSNQLVLEIPSQEIILNREKWKMADRDLLTIDLKDKTIWTAFQMQRDSAHVYFSTLNQGQSFKYTLGMNQFKPGSLIGMSPIQGKPDGTFGGFIELNTVRDGERQISTELQIRDISYYGEDLSDIYLDASLKKGLEEDYFIDFLLLADSSSIQLKGGKSESGVRNIDARFSHFPLISIQPFTREYLSELEGLVSGNFNFSNGKGRENINGKMQFENAQLKFNMLNSIFIIPDQDLNIKDYRIVFDKFRILDTLGKALMVDGFINFGEDEPLSAALDISSSNLKLMSRNKESRESFSGNIFVDSRFSVNGPLRHPVVEGKLLLAKGSEIYYQHQEDLRMSESEKIVNFVEYTAAEESSTSRISHQSKLINSSVGTIVEIDPSTKINFTLAKRMLEIDLNVTGGGELQYNMKENAQSTLLGRYEIGEGAALLKLVGWPNKDFRISRGSYIRWDGMIENPELKIEAENSVSSSYINPVDNKRRDVDFNVLLQTSGYLSDLDITFSIQTPDQYVMSVINTMSPEEQMRQALQVLLFETIDLPGISSSTDYMTQQVNQILASQLNQLTKSAIKGVDISFGLDSYSEPSQGGSSGTSTSLSYEVKKSLLNNRAQIEVSGRLHDANQQAGATDHTMNNLSFEYRLDSAASKYLKVYNEHNYEDVFEGEVIKTGIGFTYRKRYRTLSDIWRRKE